MFDAGELNGLDGLDVIMDERARELMYEEFRHVELVRVSFIKENQEGNYTSPKDLADESSNSYWWHRITEYNNYYNKGVKTLISEGFCQRVILPPGADDDVYRVGCQSFIDAGKFRTKISTSSS